MKSKKRCPYDNAVAEAAFKVIKTEFIYQEQFESLDHLRLELVDYINWFNKFRIHGTLGYKSPLDFRSQAI
ncbi:IS3 family transposase [Aerococcus urinaeequi]|jgi:transposase InsO family protein|uniref:IS3 family transposase n=1 Tax=Aerococcus urinaeequi TaxID=51665 RepID=UPI003D6C5184